MSNKVEQMDFSVRLKTSEFVKRRSVVGPIWLEIGGQAFPIDAWYDFPVAILGYWLGNMKPLIVNQAVRCECPFMDGPYLFEVTAQKRDCWVVTFIRDDLDGKKCLVKGELAPPALISEVLSAAETVIDLCQQRRWESDDLVTLEKEAEEVKSLMQSFPG
jgi:hypothetical protein